MTLADWVLIATTAFAWYHVGFVWLVQVVAWPLFAYVGQREFDAYHRAWWSGIRYILFVPSGLTFLGGLYLVMAPPTGVPVWLLAFGFGMYVLMYVLTALWWGPQQAKLTDTRSPRFSLIIRTHWLRTALVSAYACCFLAAIVLRMK